MHIKTHIKKHITANRIDYEHRVMYVLLRIPVYCGRGTHRRLADSLPRLRPGLWGPAGHKDSAMRTGPGLSPTPPTTATPREATD